MNLTSSPAWKILRDADWLNGQRARIYPRLLLAASLGLALIWILVARGGVDAAGKPLGTDFVSFWTASQLTLQGRAAEAYDVAAHWGAQKALFGPDVGYAAFFYPPPYLLVCLPLAAAPYFWSLIVWLAATGFAYWRVLRAWAGPRFEAAVLFAFPAFLVNAGHGQNGFLSAALMGAGALALGRRPVIAGLLFGALVFKPQLALMIPFALIAARRWTALAVAAATAAALCAVSYAIWGEAVWRAFLDAAPLARAALERHFVGDEKMQSAFAAVRLLHGPLTLAYAAQGVTALAAAAALFWLQRCDFRGPSEGPALIAATLLASPFLLDYDLTLLAFPLAFLGREGLARGFAPFEKSVLVIAYLLPLLSRILAGALLLPLAPPILFAVLWFVVNRRAGESVASLLIEATES
jgi:alpha-1,2-mannosyltransferase